MSLGPLDLNGQSFLILYDVLLAVTILAGVIVPKLIRPEGRSRRIADPDQLAWLAGGGPRFVDTVVARLLAARVLVMSASNRFTFAHTSKGGPIERSLAALPAPIKWKAIERAVRKHAPPLERRLMADGLIATPEETANIRFWQTAPYILLLSLGVTKWIVGDMRDRPVGILSVMLIVTLIFAVIRWFWVDRRTRAGLAAVKEARSTSDRIRRAPTDPEIGMAVALFGTSVLAGSMFGDFHKLRAASNSGDGGGSSDSSDGGGGCGGGGCGGCS